MSEQQVGVGVKSDKAEQLTITGRWTAEEHSLFLHGLEMHGKDYKKIAALIKSRNVTQVCSHAQKHFQKLAKKEAGPPPVSLDPFYQARVNGLQRRQQDEEKRKIFEEEYQRDKQQLLLDYYKRQPKKAKSEANRKRTEREQESKEAKAARLEKDKQRYHNKKAKDRRVEFSDSGVPKLCDSAC